MDKQEAQLVGYETAVSTAQTNAQTNPMAFNATMIAQQQKQNIVEWELDFSSELVDIERLLRCDVLMRDKDGNEFWMPNPDPEKVFFNELGVNDLLRKIRIVVNKGKVLSNYNADEIRERVFALENELRVLIYNQYENYGMDNEYKMNNYSMIVLTIGSLIEDAYRRAMGGEGHRGLNEQRFVSQNETIMPQGMMNAMSNSGQKKAHWYSPWSWGKNS